MQQTPRVKLERDVTTIKHALLHIHYEGTLIITVTSNQNRPGKEIRLGIRWQVRQRKREQKKKGRREQATHRRETIQFTHVTIGASELYGALGME